LWASRRSFFVWDIIINMHQSATQVNRTVNAVRGVSLLLDLAVFQGHLIDLCLELVQVAEKVM